MACHKTRGIGVEVGPDLSTVASKPDEQLIEAIFDPNRAVEQRNATTQVTQKDGAMILGLLVTETPHSITLRMPGGADVVVQRASIRELKTLNTSLMLVGLESVITPQECADLLAWIRTGR
jgi:putative heme-binding domain-containing protein